MAPDTTARATTRPVGRTHRCGCATAGSVDDGKSTLVGRLLHDTKSVLTDTLDARASRSAGARAWTSADLVAAGRRAAGRARAGHHDRRRLPLLRHPGADVHPGRLPRARAVHPEHGHRRLDRRRGRAARRRPQRRGRADPPAPAPWPRCCGVPHVVLAVNKIDLVDYAEERVHRDRHRVRPAGPQPRTCPTPTASRCRPPRATTSVIRSTRIAVVQRADRARIPGDGRRHPAGRRSPSSRFPVQHVVRPQSGRSAPWASRTPSLTADYRGYAGQDRLRQGAASATRSSCCPAARTRRWTAIDTADGPLELAVAGQSVMLRLDRRHRHLPRRPDRCHRRATGSRPRDRRHGVLAGRARADGRGSGAGPARDLDDQGPGPRRSRRSSISAAPVSIRSGSMPTS